MKMKRRLLIRTLSFVSLTYVLPQYWHAYGFLVSELSSVDSSLSSVLSASTRPSLTRIALLTSREGVSRSSDKGELSATGDVLDD